MKNTLIGYALLLVAMTAFACGESGEFMYGESLDDLTLNLSDETAGIHPSQVVLGDPNNPFRRTRSGIETKWQIETARKPIASFYSWATWLATEPTGEHQYYVGLSLRAIYQRELVPDEQRETVRMMAVAAFMAVLEHFPDAVTYDITGTVAYPITLDAYGALVDLGGDPSPWVVVEASDGQAVVIK
jgi:hypothetical protein